MRDQDLTFQGVNIKFDWTNEEWATTLLPHVRVALAILEKDDTALQTAMGKMVKGGVVPTVLEGWCDTKGHLKAMVEVLDSALARSFVVLERLGYDPDNLPPDSSVH
jgi:hypothetical protein